MKLYIKYDKNNNNQIISFSDKYMDEYVEVSIDSYLFQDIHRAESLDGWYYYDNNIIFHPLLYKKIFFMLDANSTIQGISNSKDNDLTVETQYTTKEFEELFGQFNLTNGKYKYINNEVVYIEENPLSSSVLQQLRSMRETECFSIINRGQLWYFLLTKAQLQELKEWYQAWLDVTETGIVPEKPYWLGER